MRLRAERRRRSARRKQHEQPLAPSNEGDDLLEAVDVDHVAECRDRVRLEQARAAVARDPTQRERHLDRAALWRAIADLLARDRAATAEAALQSLAPGETPDAELLAAYLGDVTARGTA
jgi:hypothetical protein